MEKTKVFAFGPVVGNYYQLVKSWKLIMEIRPKILVGHEVRCKRPGRKKEMAFKTLWNENAE